MNISEEDRAQCREAKKEIMEFAAQLEERGLPPLMIADGLFAALIEIGVAFAGRPATASCLIEWAERLMAGGEKYPPTSARIN